jgi:serine/threonine-protein kinase
MTVEGSILGTVCYMSPEQAQAKTVDPRSDIFSFGLVLYEMLTGQKAFSGDSALSTLSSILRDEAKPIGELVEGVPPELEQIVHRAMRKEPDQRWQTMTEMRAALMVLKQKADSGILQTQLGGTPVPKKKSSPLPMVIAAAAVVVLAAAGGGGWWWMKHRQAQQKPPVVAQVAPAPAPPPAVPEASAAPPVETPAPADAGMTNQDVLDMVQEKVPAVTIINQIRASKTKFDLSTAGVIQLTKGGVQPSIIEVMRNPKADIAAARVSAPRSAPATAPPPTKASQTPAPPIPAGATPVPVATPAAPPPAPVQAAPAAPAPAAPTRINTVSVPDAKPFNITLAQNVPVKLTAGQKINFTITNDVKVGDVVVIAKGTPVSGVVVDAGDTKKLLVVKGKATFKLTNVDSAGGTKLNIRTTPAHTDKGDRPIELQGTKTKELLAPAGTEYMAYIDSDQTVTIKH